MLPYSVQNLKIHLLLESPSAIKCPPHPEMKTNRGEEKYWYSRLSSMASRRSDVITMQAGNMKFWVGLGWVKILFWVVIVWFQEISLRKISGSSKGHRLDYQLLFRKGQSAPPP